MFIEKLKPYIFSYKALITIVYKLFHAKSQVIENDVTLLLMLFYAF